VHWYHKADAVDRHAVSELFIQWKWLTGAVAMVGSLRRLKGAGRERVLTGLQRLTGRDLGNNSKAWLSWIRKRAISGR
jgi:hypothetical protein